MGNKLDKKAKKIVLEPELERKLQSVFYRFDLDSNGSITKEEISTRFAHAAEQGDQRTQLEYEEIYLNVVKLFISMDSDKNGEIDLDEFMLFWKSVRAQNKSVEQILKGLEKLLNIVDK